MPSMALEEQPIWHVPDRPPTEEELERFDEVFEDQKSFMERSPEAVLAQLDWNHQRELAKRIILMDKLGLAPEVILALLSIEDTSQADIESFVRRGLGADDTDTTESHPLTEPLETALEAASTNLENRVSPEGIDKIFETQVAYIDLAGTSDEDLLHQLQRLASRPTN